MQMADYVWLTQLFYGFRTVQERLSMSCGYHLEKRCIGRRFQGSSSRLVAFFGLALVVRFPQDLLVLIDLR